MESDWASCTLDCLAEIKTGKLDSNHAIENGTYPFFTCAPSPLKINHFAFDCEAIILAGNNANGIFHLNRYAGKFNAYQRTYVITARDPTHVDIDFLFFALRTLIQRLGEYSQGTATKFLTKTLLTSLPLWLPPISEQRSIGKTLSSLDRSIQSLQQRNKVLEAIARATFKSWFVDFDPVWAKAEGREPEGMDAATAALFPDEFEDSVHGLMPAGWIIGQLEQYLHLEMWSAGKLPPLPEESFTEMMFHSSRFLICMVRYLSSLRERA
jgi:type I restriction enzyme S subunit